MAKKLVILVLLVGLSLCTVNAYAYEKYENNAATKFGRGMVNTFACWMEIPKQAFLTIKERGTLTGLVFGSAKGMGYMVMRLIQGLYDTAFCFFPPYDELLIEPEYVFEGWEENPCEDYY